jgi:protein required for attachment to host cells
MKPVRTWIVIADGARARIVKNAGPRHGVEADSNLVFRSEHRKLQEIMADKPGRAFDSVGKGRHAMALGADAVREDERHFLQSLAERLEKEAMANAYDRLILIAPPRALGDLRSFLSKPVKNRVHDEIAKDLTQLPNDRLANHLGDTINI